MTIYYTLEPMSCSAIFEKLPPAADWKKYRDPQPHIKQRMKDLRTLNFKRDVPIKSLPSELRKLQRRGGGKKVKARDGGHQAIKAF